MEIFKLFGSILVDSSEAEKSISKTEGKAESFSTKLGNGIKTAGKWAAAIGAGALAAGGAMIAFATKAGNAADRLLDLNSITGMSTDEIQKWERVTKVAGVSVDAVTNASQKLTKSLDGMSNGTGKGAESLKKLGLSFEEISSMDADQRMDAITQALAGVEDKTERAKLGTDLLGGSWKDIAPIVDLGAEAMQNAKDSANIISEDDLKKANDFRISMDLMKDRVSFLAMELGIKLIPIAEKFFDWVDGHMPQIEKFFDIAFTVISEVVTKAADIIDQYLMPFLQFLWTWVEENLPEIQEFFKNVFETILEIIQTFVDVAQKIWEEYGDFIVTHIKTVFESIKIYIDGVIKAIKAIIKIVLSAIKGDWEGVWDGIKDYFSAVWETIKNLLPKFLEALYNILKLSFSIFKDLGHGMFNMVWEGMKGIWSSISGWVSDKVSWLTDKLAFWRKSNNEMVQDTTPTSNNNSNQRVHGSHASGLAYVPFDGYRAELHKGEEVLTANDPRNQNNGGGQGTNNNIVIENMIVRDDQDIKKIARELFILQNQKGRGQGIVRI